jgi:hypothetical protein
MVARPAAMRLHSFSNQIQVLGGASVRFISIERSQPAVPSQVGIVHGSDYAW